MGAVESTRIRLHLRGSTGWEQFYVTKCPKADLAIELGAADLGFMFFWLTDACLAEGWSEQIGFKRTQTFMEGHTECDHFYY